MAESVPSSIIVPLRPNVLLISSAPIFPMCSVHCHWSIIIASHNYRNSNVISIFRQIVLQCTVRSMTKLARGKNQGTKTRNKINEYTFNNLQICYCFTDFLERMHVENDSVSVAAEFCPRIELLGRKSTSQLHIQLGFFQKKQGTKK